MSRTARHKILYFTTMGVAVLAAVGFAYWMRFAPAILLVVPVLLLPGRVLGYFWRDLLRGRRLLDAHAFERSKQHSEKFLAQVQARPWLKRLIWLASGTYSGDPQAMAFNNLGAAELELGETDAARRHLNAAIAIDALYPVPFYNLGQLSLRNEDDEEAGRCFAQARRLGYSGGWSDKAVIASQRVLAKIEG